MPQSTPSITRAKEKKEEQKAKKKKKKKNQEGSGHVTFMS
jgi:hypothetical protein